MPEDQKITFWNVTGMCLVLAVNFGVASVLAIYRASVLEVCLACLALLLLSLLCISRLESM